MNTYSEKPPALLVWDAKGTPPEGNWTTILWNTFADVNGSNSISIPSLVEEQADKYRSRYLAWVHDFGEMPIAGKKLVAHLELKNGFSYWWMTELAQKFNTSGTSQIDNSIKALALESIVSQLNPGVFILVSGNRKLHHLFFDFCKAKGIRYKWKSDKQSEKPRKAFRKAFHCLPGVVRAFSYLIWHVISIMPAVTQKRLKVGDSTGKTSFFDILVHLDRKAMETGRFISNYWTSLVDLLGKHKLKANWIHNYFPHGKVQSVQGAQSLVSKFNAGANEVQSHILIDACLSFTAALKAVQYYRIIHLKSRYLFKEIRKSVPADSCLDFWKLFKGEWISTMRGHIAMMHCLRIALFERTMQELPYQRLGVYIQENQPWEAALIHSWKLAGHGRLIGVPHTTVRYWDLRYFNDPRAFESGRSNGFPIPDLVAVNGPIAKKRYLEGGYPASNIAEVEALRFAHLLRTTPKKKIIQSKQSSHALKILVCGDFLASTNEKLLSWISKAAAKLPPETVFLLKPHPAYPVDVNGYPDLALQVITQPLSDLFAQADIVFTSNITSAAVDAYCYGLPVVQMLDGSTFNLSPLRGLKGVDYAKSAAELTEILLNFRHHTKENTDYYFYLDSNLTRWKRLLKLGDRC